MDNFFIITNRPKDPELKVTGYICDFLKNNGKNCSYTELSTQNETERSDEQGITSVPESAQCILVLGGDGTMLRAATKTLHLDIPLIGINLGDLGFLAEIDKTNLDESLTMLIGDKWQKEERMMLSGVIKSNGEYNKKIHALNDIVLTRSGSLQIVSYDIFVNGQYLNSYHADGLIISTPTGSTGYNLSAGGPIVEPTANLILITPICPHTMNTRSIILSPEAEIEVKIAKRKDGDIQKTEINFDGNACRYLFTNDSIVITRSTKMIKLIRLNEVSFLEVLQQKISR